MKTRMMTTPTLLICLLALLTVGFALHSMSQAQPNRGLSLFFSA